MYRNADRYVYYYCTSTHICDDISVAFAFTHSDGDPIWKERGNVPSIRVLELPATNRKCRSVHFVLLKMHPPLIKFKYIFL